MSFATIGLLEMFNTGGAVEKFEINLASDMNSELCDDGLSSHDK